RRRRVSRRFRRVHPAHLPVRFLHLVLLAWAKVLSVRGAKWLALSLLISLALCAPPLSAKEDVQLLSAPADSPAIEEILVRAQAELGTVGFSVVRCADGACDESQAVGRLSVTEQDGKLLLRASRQDTLTLTQELDLSEREISPEVAAIRAVELLRAVLLLAIREGSLKANEGSAVREFTSFEEPTPVPPPPPQTPQQPPRVVVEPSSPRSSWSWSLGVGPSVSLPAVGVSPGLGGEFYLDAVYRFFYVGGAIDAMLLPSVLERPEGRTKITAINTVVRAGVAIPCKLKWMCHVGGSLGFLQYDLQANESTSFTGSD